MVWGTVQYESLWAAAMKLGESQAPETPDDDAAEGGDRATEATETAEATDADVVS